MCRQIETDPTFVSNGLSTVVNLNNEARKDMETQSKSRVGSLWPVWSLTLV